VLAAVTTKGVNGRSRRQLSQAKLAILVANANPRRQLGPKILMTWLAVLV